ncbi:hypothetical protein F7725_014297 [Dissostichus mawsoni]|uniref:Uncharacterized protein n=1 Tax=Dissostichus mawsoni TaxID=36200 RepID=A0A7J5YXY5_DISMA|nr:hypothetical protein F7725_014297 [Dissostichus mawsoni]
MMCRVEVLLQEGHRHDSLRHPGWIQTLLPFEHPGAGAEAEQTSGPRAFTNSVGSDPSSTSSTFTLLLLLRPNSEGHLEDTNTETISFGHLPGSSMCFAAVPQEENGCLSSWRKHGGSFPALTNTCSTVIRAEVPFSLTLDLLPCQKKQAVLSLPGVPALSSPGFSDDVGVAFVQLAQALFMQLLLAVLFDVPGIYSYCSQLRLPPVVRSHQAVAPLHIHPSSRVFTEAGSLSSRALASHACSSRSRVGRSMECTGL